MIHPTLILVSFCKMFEKQKFINMQISCIITKCMMWPGTFFGKDSPLSHAGGILSKHPAVNEELRTNEMAP